jgi:hypothetical protein
MLSVFKFPVGVGDSVLMPVGAKILSVQVQRGVPCLWALCDPEARLVRRSLKVYGTGHPVPDNPGTFVGTFQLDDRLVFHVFDKG